eukprot:705058-Heterocapsa_arctica.AAC.1
MTLADTVRAVGSHRHPVHREREEEDGLRVQAPASYHGHLRGDHRGQRSLPHRAPAGPWRSAVPVDLGPGHHQAAAGAVRRDLGPAGPVPLWPGSTEGHLRHGLHGRRRRHPWPP